MRDLFTPWGETLDKNCPLPEYPRPQLKRESYLNLNGLWNYTVQDGEEYTKNKTGTIVVPFSPESILSGCDFQLQSGETLWYERTFTLPEGFRKDRVLLHFGAVDQSCRVLVNDKEVGGHEGGYLPFTLDITEALCDGENRLTVAVTDKTEDSVHAYGKQRYDRGGIWYTAQSGIWQTVWLESVVENYITSIELTPDFDSKRLYWRIHAKDPQGAHVVVRKDGKCIAEDWDYESDDGSGWSLISDEHFRPWSPEDPFLYTVEIDIKSGDHVESYFGMRKFSIVEHQGRKVLGLNNKPYFQHGLLDQGYWSDGLYTPPSDEAMIWDIRTMKDLGFNMLRKHIKIEPLRWYYHCDRLGMIVWQDMVCGGKYFIPMTQQYLPFIGIHLRDDRHYSWMGRGDEGGRLQFESDLDETVQLLYNCVSLGLWVPFNEGWGQFDSLRITERLRQLDDTRPIDHASGWNDQGGGDLKSRHIYFHPVKLKNDGRRVLALTEFGGYSLPVPEHYTTDKEFGYRSYQDNATWMDALEKLYEEQIIPHLASQGLSAAVYTQVSDVEDEVNGLVTYDRKVVKADAKRMQAIAKKLQF